MIKSVYRQAQRPHYWLLRQYNRWRAGVDNLDAYRSSTKPIIRWIKGNGLDDQITRTALAQATRLFGAEVDYCLCTIDISEKRAKKVLEWAHQPVKWFPVGPTDNSRLTQKLKEADCASDRFGYWWKWYPDRVRPHAPEWILDGDMVITGKPKWFDDWKNGTDCIRVAQSNDAPMKNYGEYANLADPRLMLYSGLISLPPGVAYMDEVIKIMTKQPLKTRHHGCHNMSEQGVIAAAFASLKATPIPLYEFPFAISGHKEICYGLEGNIGEIWGYHFGNSFQRKNDFFEQFSQDGTVDRV